MTGPSGEVHITENPAKWIQDNQWPDFYRNIHGLDEIPIYNEFEDIFMKHNEDF